MKRLVSVGLALAIVALMAAGALAQGPGNGMMGPRMMGPRGGGMGPGPGGMGPGMGPGANGGDWVCPMAGGQAAQPAAVTEERAKELAQAYADQYLKGFTVERVLPFQSPRGTMYTVELKGPDSQVRTFHINRFGNVMPFGPARRG